MNAVSPQCKVQPSGVKLGNPGTVKAVGALSRLVKIDSAGK